VLKGLPFYRYRTLRSEGLRVCLAKKPHGRHCQTMGLRNGLSLQAVLCGQL
jgi:hypothetical protein